MDHYFPLLEGNTNTSYSYLNISVESLYTKWNTNDGCDFAAFKIESANKSVNDQE